MMPAWCLPHRSSSPCLLQLGPRQELEWEQTHLQVQCCSLQTPGTTGKPKHWQSQSALCSQAAPTCLSPLAIAWKRVFQPAVCLLLEVRYLTGDEKQRAGSCTYQDWNNKSCCCSGSKEGVRKHPGLPSSSLHP